ncbi:hypothetical protein ERTO105960_01500 [Erysipelothrix tonsillarum]
MNEDIYIFIDDSGKIDNNTIFIYGCVCFID